ncbi:MAG: xanthine dehydrogenase family protein molybdopterin-binding subunit, partial [Pirellulaceae bacterium]
MAAYSWPTRDQARYIGKDTNRVDGLVKATGAAKYTYDINLKNQLIVKSLASPHAACKIKSIDTSATETVPGVVHIHILDHARPGREIRYQGELLVAVAAESEGAAALGVSKLRVEYERLPAFTADDDLDAAIAADRTRKAGDKVELEREPGEEDDEDEFIEQEIRRLFKESKVILEGYYGVDAITHCCLETHGVTVEWKDGKLTVYLSTQNVSKTDDQMAGGLEITADDVTVLCDYIGGGFGSKFAPDYWAVAAAKISRATGRPVKFMLDRDQDQKIAGNRPSGYIKVRIGADEKGVMKVWDSHHWGTSGPKGGGVSHKQIPYVIVPKNFRRVATGIESNTAQSRAWRAPNHPQGCALSQTALDDLAAKLGADSYEVFKANLEAGNVVSQYPSDYRPPQEIYLEEMEVAARLMDWKAQWHPHGKGTAQGSVVNGLGMGLHTWGGGANASSCLLRVRPDGSVETFCGTQDLGTGTRTICHKVVAETFGLDIGDPSINIGSSKYPFSGASGGSTTVGAVCESHRRAAQDALAKICERVAKELDVDAASLVAADGRICLKNDDTQCVTWKKACSLLGVQPLEVTSKFDRGSKSPLSSNGVGGVQMAHVAV